MEIQTTDCDLVICPPVLQTFSNTCEAAWSWGKKLYDGVCYQPFKPLSQHTVVTRANTNKLTRYHIVRDFRYDDTVTREESTKMFLSFIYKLKDNNLKIKKQDIPSDFYIDSNTDQSLSTYVQESVSMGLFNIDPFYKAKASKANWFDATWNLTKAQAYAILMRIFAWKLNEQTQPRYRNYLLAWYDRQRAIMKSTKTFDQPITRGELAERMMRINEYVIKQ
jgi:hypothetical protein